MSDIYIDRINIEQRVDDVLSRADELDTALTAIPAPADGGAATALIGFIAAAAAEAANEYSGAVHLIGRITNEVMADTFATEEERVAEISAIEQELEG